MHRTASRSGVTGAERQPLGGNEDTRSDMKKRLRKKLRLGEFRQFGFEVSFRLPENLGDDGVDAFWDTFIREAIEVPGLMCGGGCGREWDIFVCRPDRKSATEEDRRVTASWLEGHVHVSDIHIGPLVDAWHPA